MFTNLALERPLAVIDVETTGTNPQVDRIVEISVLKVYPSGERQQRTRRINPGIPIPAEASAVHGIKDADVADQPKFAQVAAGLISFLDGCDLCGFNLKKFDLRVLHAEFARASVPFSLANRAVVDPMEIYHRKEPRNLAAALRFYCDRDHDDGHRAEADVLATAEVLDAMLGRYPDLPRTVAGLQTELKSSNAVDTSGFFIRVEGEVRFANGKHRGQPLDAVARHSPDYLSWMLRQDFFEDTKTMVRRALQRTQLSGVSG
jgi:DNA polymerase III subunit epsilon